MKKSIELFMVKNDNFKLGESEKRVISNRFAKNKLRLILLQALFKKLKY